MRARLGLGCVKAPSEFANLVVLALDSQNTSDLVRHSEQKLKETRSGRSTPATGIPIVTIVADIVSGTSAGLEIRANIKAA